MGKNKNTIAIGNRMELFVDTFLIEDTNKAALRMNQPQRREVVLPMDQPWEGPGSGIYSVVFQDGELFRMYYRATFPQNEHDASAGQGSAYAESTDGIHWERPKLGIVSHQGQDTNMVFSGPNAHNFSPFLDKNPACKPEEKFKAIAGHRSSGLLGYTSQDGFHWERMQDDALITDGAFDSHNVVFYDTLRKQYACYSRFFDISSKLLLTSGVRAIQHSFSEDFLNWPVPVPNTYDENVPYEHFYTNATIPCPGAEHLFLSFPMRFMHERHKVECHAHVGVSDNVMMTSRDGKHWDRPFLESWIKPGLDQRNWTERNLIVAQGIIETGDEFSMYINENYRWDSACIRRVTVPKYRFGSLYANRAGGTFTTKPILFTGSRLNINYATSAPGSVRVGIVDENGWPMAQYAAEDCDVIYGDELEKQVSWRGDADLSHLKGKVVRFKFELIDADVYAMQVQ